MSDELKVENDPQQNDDSEITPQAPEPNTRLFVYKCLKGSLILFNLYCIYEAIVIFNYMSRPSELGQNMVDMMGVYLLGALWVVVNLILGVITLIVRPKKATKVHQA